ncbi:MAG TPA: tripartite tricarboxylate transporter permease [Pelagibacterium sp.]|uniref:tripartite tricarboxylate transporter permease n=1 Tax=Pelagibacterium sp. TaxID=1967288 RepID=UPI002C734C01|nr:tripartite tricarboxylate transporter permease [Pelagibacterium sp.]HWJ89379.1 tripartite tricarboxylate transporter permease [Pelagibacterium sp.]
MSEFLANISLGLTTALTLNNLLYCAIGVTLGTLVGVIPGIGTLAAMSLLFPLTFYLDPIAGLVMLGGIYYGTTYGGSTASILLNLPGTPSNAVVCFDGYPMAQQGRAGVALFMTTIASFVGGSIGIVVIMLFSPFVVSVALEFGSVEYFLLMLVGLLASAVVANAAPIRGIAMVVLGVLLGLVGVDINSGAPRFTFGTFALLDGISLVALAMGLFGVSEIMASVRGLKSAKVEKNISMRTMLPTRDDWRRTPMPMVRGATIGSFLGALPGTGGILASFMAYALETRVAKEPERFGKGAIEGIMAPETANNAADQTSFIPTLALGIPGTASMALMLGVLMIHGISPGPTLMVQRPELFWGVIMSFWVGNILLLVLNIPLIGVWMRILTIPYHILYPSVLVLVCIGVYSVNYSVLDVAFVCGFGVLGYLMRTLDFPAAPLLLGYVLGPLVEQHFRRAMVLSYGEFSTFVGSKLSISLLAIVAGILLYALWRSWLSFKRRPALASK